MANKGNPELRGRIFDLVAEHKEPLEIAHALGIDRKKVQNYIYRMRRDGTLPSPDRPARITKAEPAPPSNPPIAGVLMGSMERVTMFVATCPKCGARFHVTEPGNRRA